MGINFNFNNYFYYFSIINLFFLTFKNDSILKFLNFLKIFIFLVKKNSRFKLCIKKEKYKNIGYFFKKLLFSLHNINGLLFYKKKFFFYL
jgi:hypothetical protein